MLLPLLTLMLMLLDQGTLHVPAVMMMMSHLDLTPSHHNPSDVPLPLICPWVYPSPGMSIPLVYAYWVSMPGVPCLCVVRDDGHAAIALWLWLLPLSQVLLLLCCNEYC